MYINKNSDSPIIPVIRPAFPILLPVFLIAFAPKIIANNIDASLIQEAAIGKIAGEQLTKLMTLGLTEKEAEEQIISGFLK